MTTDRTIEKRGDMTFIEIERRGGTRIMEAGAHEPLPYAVFCDRSLVARTTDRITATWILDCLEGKAP